MCEWGIYVAIRDVKRCQQYSCGCYSIRPRLFAAAHVCSSRRLRAARREITAALSAKPKGESCCQSSSFRCLNALPGKLLPYTHAFECTPYVQPLSKSSARLDVSSSSVVSSVRLPSATAWNCSRVLDGSYFGQTSPPRH